MKNKFFRRAAVLTAALFLSLIHICQGAGKSTFFRLLAVKDEWFSDDLRKLDDDNVYRKLQGHWIIEMSEMIATANAKSIEEIKSFLSRQKEAYKIPYETHPADRPRDMYKRQFLLLLTIPNLTEF